MKTKRYHYAICRVTGILLVISQAACLQTPQAARIEKHTALFDPLPAAVKKDVARGSIAPGYTPDMVFLALGAPDAIESAADGRSFVWTYRNFYPSAEVVAESLYYIPEVDPLKTTFEMWRHNQSRYDQLTMDPRERKQASETWSEYTRRHNPDSSLSSPLETRTFNARDIDRPDILPDIEPMRLDVVFEQKVVATAFINETISAFTRQPEPSP